MGEILVGFGCVAYSFMPDVGFADVGHKRRETAERVKRRAALLTSFLRLFAYFSSIPHARYAGVGDSCKTELILLCAAFLPMPYAGFVGMGHKREMKAEGIRQRVTLLVSLFL